MELVEALKGVRDVSKFSFRKLTRSSCFPNRGHLVVNGKCLTLINPNNGPPFTLAAEDCYLTNDGGQAASSFILEVDGSIYFIGK